MPNFPLWEKSRIIYIEEYIFIASFFAFLLSVIVYYYIPLLIIVHYKNVWAIVITQECVRGGGNREIVHIVHTLDGDHQQTRNQHSHDPQHFSLVVEDPPTPTTASAMSPT